MWTPHIKESAELTQGTLYLIQYSEGIPYSQIHAPILNDDTIARSLVSLTVRD